MDILSRRLKKLREDNNLTQEKFGEIIHVKRGTVCYYEKGRNKPSIEDLAKLAEHFRISLNYFVGHDHYVISEDNLDYGMSMSDEEITFIKEVRRDVRLHNQLMDNPSNLVSRMKMRL